mgnify:CR=1 FL=1
MWRSLQLVCFAIGLAPGVPAWATVVDFEDLAIPPQSAVNNTLGFVSRGAQFVNTFTDFGNGLTAWSGFALSNKTDAVTPGFANQYSAYHTPGGGGDQSPNYAIGYWSDFDPAIITLPVGAHPLSLRVTNSTYTALSMQNGDAFARKFGGDTGADPDFLLLKITGLDDQGQPIGVVDFYLADYRAADSRLDYIVNQWTTIDLISLAAARRLSFSLDSSDRGVFGINTPTYFAIDNLVYAVPEPGGWLLALGMVAPGVACWRRRRNGARRSTPWDRPAGPC